MERVLNFRVAFFWLGILKLVFQFHINAEVIDRNANSRIFYDQRQTGKFNIHLSIKDVAIIEMNQNEFEDDSISDEDYYYDEDDLTVKPFPSWITKPSEEQTSQSPLDNFIKKNSTKKPTFPPYTPQKPLPPILIPISVGSSTKGPYISLNTTRYDGTDAPIQTSLGLSSSSSQSKFLSTNYTTNSSTRDLITVEKNMSSIESQVSIDVEPIAPAKLSARTNNILAQTREIPVLHPKQRHTHLSNLIKRPTATEFYLGSPKGYRKDDSKIYNLKINRVQKKTPATLGYPIPFRYNLSPRRCRSGHFLDETGICRNKRTSSILRKLFRMLSSLPLTDLETAEEAFN